MFTYLQKTWKIETAFTKVAPLANTTYKRIQVDVDKKNFFKSTNCLLIFLNS